MTRKLPLWQRILRYLLKLPTPPPMIMTHLGVPPSEIPNELKKWEDIPTKVEEVDDETE